MAGNRNPTVPAKAYHRLMRSLVKMAHKGVDAKPEEFDRAAEVFTLAGGSWERLFKGSVDDLNLLKRVVKVAVEKEVFSKASKWASDREAARPIRIDRGAVEQLIDRLIKGLGRVARSDPEKPFGNYPRSIVGDSIIVTDVAGNEHDVEIHLFANPSKSAAWVTGGAFGHRKRGPDKGRPGIFIELNGKYPRKTFAEVKLVRDELRQAIMHELTHASDFPGTKGYAPVQKHIPGIGEIDPVAYYNHPKEVRAYMREVFEDIAPTVRKIMGTSLGDDWGLGGAITRILRDNSIWREMTPYLTRQNKNRILKGIVTAFEDEGYGR